MSKKLGVIFMLAILTVVVLASSCIQQGNQNNYNISSPQNEVKTPVSNGTAIDIQAKQNGPTIAHKGQNVTINYSVTNNGTQSVYKVKVHDQNFDKTLGTINPGENKKFQHSLYIPTDDQVKADFGPNATVSNPFLVGGFGVSFQDVNGSKHSVTASTLEIKLV
jgi:Translocon-associated protein beta (TRAPB)